MKLRSKLIVSFLFLSVVPLSALVLYSYWSSTRSLRQAVEMENVRLAGEMEERMTLVRQGMDQRLQRLSSLPFEELMAAAETPEGGWPELSVQVGAVMGELAPLLESLELVPAEPVPAGWPAEAGDALAPRPGTGALPGYVVWLRQGTEPVPETAEVASSVALAVVEQVVQGALEGLRPGSPAAFAGAPEEPSAAPAAAAEEPARKAVPAPGAPAGAPPPRVASAAAPWLELARAVGEQGLEAARLAAHASRKAENARLLGGELECPLEVEGEKVGRLKAQVAARQVLTAVLSLTRRDRGEIPFAVDSEGQLYTADEADRGRLEALGLTAEGEPAPSREDWVVVRLADGESGLVYGIARPIQDSLMALRRNAGRNFGYGLGLVGLALLGIAPLSRRITRDLSDLTAGAGRLAAGDLATRVPVRSKDEVGHLAATFYRMAADIEENQARLIEQERLRKEEEVRRRLVEADNERKGRELEEARSFQLSLLPRQIPEHPDLEIAVFMRTATEVGGDYYDFHLAPGGALTVALGDATGHGARAGTMVTVLKSLFTAQAGEAELPAFLTAAAHTIRCMELGRMAMALTLARLDGRRLRLAAAGMPPALLYRAAAGEVEEIASPGVPLGALAEATYGEREAALAAGDVLLLMSDGLPELADAAGDPLGYGRSREAFQAAATAGAAPREIIDRLSAAAAAWKPGPPDDDMTFLVIRVRPG